MLKGKFRSKKLQPGYGRGGREGDGDIELVESVYIWNWSFLKSPKMDHT